jgi:hypothetical protein
MSNNLMSIYYVASGCVAAPLLLSFLLFSLLLRAIFFFVSSLFTICLSNAKKMAKNEKGIIECT